MSLSAYALWRFISRLPLTTPITGSVIVPAYPFSTLITTLPADCALSADVARPADVIRLAVEPLLKLKTTLPFVPMEKSLLLWNCAPSPTLIVVPMLSKSIVASSNKIAVVSCAPISETEPLPEIVQPFAVRAAPVSGSVLFDLNSDSVSVNAANAQLAAKRENVVIVVLIIVCFGLMK